MKEIGNERKLNHGLNNGCTYRDLKIDEVLTKFGDLWPWVCPVIDFGTGFEYFNWVGLLHSSITLSVSGAGRQE